MERSPTVKTLAIDPGSVQTGYAYRADGNLHSGVLKAPKGWPRWKRIASIRDQFRTMLFENAGFDALVIEIPGNKPYKRNRGKGGAHTNIHAISVVGMVIGALAIEAHDNELAIFEADAAEWTRGSSKALRMQIAGIDAGRKITNDNEADAICLLGWFKRTGG